MLYFSKIRIFLISLFTLIFVIFALSNFSNVGKKIFNKEINLGLDLQGGSYLLLEIDNRPIIEQKLQNTLLIIRKYFKDKDIKYQNLKIQNDKFIVFDLNNDDIEKTKNLFIDKDSDINPYYIQFKSHQFDLEINKNTFKLEFSKHGLIQVKNSSLDQALEIVRRRIDEVGTNEPNILKRGNDRILVELPGLDDPMRVKNLLGKTANLTFRFISKNTEETFGVEKLSFEDGSENALVSKRIVISGEHLLDAQPTMDNQTNQTVVTFNLDRVGAKRFGKATKTGIGKRLAIVLDGKIVSAPVIQSAILGGSGQI